MAFQPAPQMAQMIIKGRAHGVPVANVLGFKFAGTYGASDIAELALIGASNTGVLYKALINADSSYDEVLVRGLTSETDFEASSSADAGVGTLVDEGVPNNVSLCLTLRTANTGRSARGRFYGWPTGKGNLTSANEFTDDYGAALKAAVDSVRVSAPAAGWTLVIISRRTGGAPRPEAVSFPVTNVEVRNHTVDSQRGRLPSGH